MGGHGGLNILPQKRWNVYNFDNRERVRRDEEAAAREEQVRQQKAERAELEFKLGKLREIAQSKRQRLGRSDSGSLEAVAEGAIVAPEDASDAVEERQADGRPQHVNLFAEWEQREREEGPGRVQERERGRKGVEKVDGKSTGEPVNENYGLGHGAVDKNGKKPWYALKSFMVNRAQDLEQRPDPRLLIAGGVDRVTVKSKKRTVEALRAERIRREQEEKRKAQNLVVSKAGKRETGYGLLANGRGPQYHASFGNAR